MKVPFLDLKAQYETIKEEINTAIQEVINSCAFSGGPFVEKFEKEYAEFCGTDYAIGVGSGMITINCGSCFPHPKKLTMSPRGFVPL